MNLVLYKLWLTQSIGLIDDIQKLLYKLLIDISICKPTRADFVSRWMGQTQYETSDFLDKSQGSILCMNIIELPFHSDPKYPEDYFGKEALTTINNYMKIYPGKMIILYPTYNIY